MNANAHIKTTMGHARDEANNLQGRLNCRVDVGAVFIMRDAGEITALRTLRNRCSDALWDDGATGGTQ